MFYSYQTINKVNSYKERKNNSYDTETLLLSDCKMKLMKNDEKRSCLPNAEEDGVGGQGHRGKKPTSTNVVTLIDP